MIGKGIKTGKRGKNKSKWMHGERKVLWEHFVTSGGKKMGGYSVYQEGEGFVPGKERPTHNHPEVTVSTRCGRPSGSGVDVC